MVGSSSGATSGSAQRSFLVLLGDLRRIEDHTGVDRRTFKASNLTLVVSLRLHNHHFHHDFYGAVFRRKRVICMCFGAGATSF